MEAALDVLSWITLSAGALFCVVGAVGLLRMPDFYARSHAAGVTDTLGVPLILLGCALQAGLSLVTIKLGFILFFVYVTSSTATHALVKTAYRRGALPPLDRTAGEGRVTPSKT
jgi:multicomponent Na+:H+ antiporter subunit G